MKLISLYKKLDKKVKLVIKIFLVILLLVPTVTLSRYVYKIALDHYYKSKNFYFKSDLLSEKNPKYTVTNWSGVDEYTITINMNSILNDLIVATSDIEYDIFYECDDTISCTLSKDKGVIPANSNNRAVSNRDYFSLTVSPKKTFNNNEEAGIKIVTKSTKPYKKTLSAEFILRVEKVGLSYEITDSKNDIYAVLRLTNSLTYYTIIEEFLDYKIGDEIESEIYHSLSNENKSKCSSMLVDLSFDPKVLRLDMTNAYYLEALNNKDDYVSKVDMYLVNKDFADYHENDLLTNSEYNNLSSEEKKNVSGPYSYVNGFKVNIDAISSADVMFYKVNKKIDYTYPYVNDESIVTVK